MPSGFGGPSAHTSRTQVVPLLGLVLDRRHPLELERVAAEARLDHLAGRDPLRARREAQRPAAVGAPDRCELSAVTRW